MSNYYGFNGYPLPTGSILPIAVTNPNQIPDTFLYCNGAQYNSVLYPQLYAVIGDSYNTGGETAGFFRVPDLVTNPYIKGGVNNPVPSPTPTVTVPLEIATENLPNLGTADFNVSSLTFSCTTSSDLYEHQGGTDGDAGLGPTCIKNNSSTVSTFSMAYTGGQMAYDLVGPPDATDVTITFDDVLVKGWLYIHIIKAVEVGLAPQSLAPAIVPQFPAPQYLYTNMAWLNGFTAFKN